MNSSDELSESLRNREDNSDSQSSFEIIISKPSGSGDASASIPHFSYRPNWSEVQEEAHSTKKVRSRNFPDGLGKETCSHVVSRKSSNAAIVASEMKLITSEVDAITNTAAEYVANMQGTKARSTSNQ